MQTGAPALGRGDLRRLLYGLDLLAGHPVQAQVRVGAGEATVTLQNGMPGPEERLLLALGRLELPPDGKFYPRRWRLPTAHVAEIVAALEALGIEVRRAQ